MTAIDTKGLSQFLVEAKRSTYASQKGTTTPSRLSSHDLGFRNGAYSYLDSYFGEKDFSGQEVVYFHDTPVWSMNYYGRMLQDEVPSGFIETLREALMRVEADRPFRGCGTYSRGRYSYACTSEGTLLSFGGHESIAYEGKDVYLLSFHGGQIR
jgi:hypothetical protein